MPNSFLFNFCVNRKLYSSVLSYMYYNNMAIQCAMHMLFTLYIPIYVHTCHIVAVLTRLDCDQRVQCLCDFARSLQLSCTFLSYSECICTTLSMSVGIEYILLPVSGQLALTNKKISLTLQNSTLDQHQEDVYTCSSVPIYT